MLNTEQRKFAEDMRRHPRRKVLWNGDLQCGEYEFACKIFDISLRGAQIKLGLPLAPGAEMSLNVQRLGEMPCRVAWQKDGRVGLLFLAGGDYIDRKFGDKAEILGLVSDGNAPETMH